MISDLGFFGVKYLPSAKYLDVKKVSLNSLSQICSLSKVAIFMPGLLLANIHLTNFLKYETKINVFIRPLTCWLDRRPQEGWMSDLESFVRLNWFLNHAIFYLERLKRLMKEDSNSNIFWLNTQSKGNHLIVWSQEIQKKFLLSTKTPDVTLTMKSHSVLLQL